MPETSGNSASNVKQAMTKITLELTVIGRCVKCSAKNAAEQALPEGGERPHAVGKPGGVPYFLCSLEQAVRFPEQDQRHHHVDQYASGLGQQHLAKGIHHADQQRGQ